MLTEQTPVPAPTAVVNPKRRPLVFLLGITVTVCLLLLHGLIWVRSVESLGGLERYARVIDFTATLTGAQIIHAGEGANLYDSAQQRIAQEQILAPYVQLKDDTLLPYIHPPFEALVFAQLLSLPYGVLYLLWSVLIVLAFGGALFFLSRTVPITSPSRWLFLLAVGSFSPLHQAFWLGQSSPLVLLSICGVYAANKRGRDGWAGVSLALLVLKPQILLAVGLLLLLLGYWRVLVVCGGISAGLCLASMLLLGATWPLQYARFLSGIASWQGNHNEYPAIMYNWRGLLTNLLGDSRPGSLAFGVTALSLLSLGLLFGAWWWSGGGEATAQPARQDVLWSLTCLVAVLIAPHLYIHDLVILILPAWLIVARSLPVISRSIAARIWICALWGGYLLAFSSLFRAEVVPALPVVPGLLMLIAMMIALLWQALKQGELHHRSWLSARLGKAGV